MRSWGPDQLFEQTRSRLAPDRSGGARLDCAHGEITASLLSLTVRGRCTLPDGKLQVELRGLDVYDPTTGEIRSNTTDEIACWFIDSDDNEESFFVRHAYFTGADEPYKKLQRALKAEIDGEAWASLYSTVSRPFEPPSTGKIAVKVINHYDQPLRGRGAEGVRVQNDDGRLAMMSCVSRPSASVAAPDHADRGSVVRRAGRRN